MKKKKEETGRTAPKKALFNSVYNNQLQEVQRYFPFSRINLLKKLGELLDLYPRDNVNVKDEEDNTLLIAGAKCGNNDIIKLLLDKKIDINAQNVLIVSLYKYTNIV